MIALLYNDHTKAIATILQRENLRLKYLHAQNSDGLNALMVALCNSQTEDAAHSSKRQPPDEVFTAIDECGDNALMFSAQVGCTFAAINILQRDSLPIEVLTTKNNQGYNALMFGLSNNRTIIADAIFKRKDLPGEVLTATNKNGYNALMIALDHGYTDIATAILGRDNLPKEVLSTKNNCNKKCTKNC